VQTMTHEGRKSKTPLTKKIYRRVKPASPPDSAWLKHMIELRGVSMVSLAKHMGLDGPKMTRTLKGDRLASPEEIVRFAYYLHLPLVLTFAKFGHTEVAEMLRALVAREAQRDRGSKPSGED